MKNVVIIKIRDKNGDVVAVDEIALPGDTADGMTATITTIKVPARPRRKDRNPLSPDALRLADLHVGKKIRVHYVGQLSWLNSDFSAIVTGKIVNRDKEPIIPIVRLGDEPSESYHTKVFAADLGITPYKVDGSWNSVWYVTAE